MSEKDRPAFEIRLRSKRVQRELDNLQEPEYRRMLLKLKTLEENPRPQGCEKLFEDIYRVRVGDYRIIYLVDETNKRVDVGAIRRRSEKTYRRIHDLFRQATTG